MKETKLIKELQTLDNPNIWEMTKEELFDELSSHFVTQEINWILQRHQQRLKSLEYHKK